MLMTDVGVETFRCEFEISVSPTFRRQHQVVINITLAVSIHDTVSRLKKTKISIKRFKLILQKRFLIGREWQSISFEHLYEIELFLVFLP